MATLQAFDKDNRDKTIWVAVPLEMIDWMADRFSGPFTSYLAGLDPYSSVRVLDEKMTSATDELAQVLASLRTEKCDVPEVVDLFGPYGLPGAKKTVSQMVEFFDRAVENDWKVISIGD